MELTFTAPSGFVEVGSIVLFGGPWTWLEPGETLSLRADRFFRAGYSDPYNGAVHLRRERWDVRRMLCFMAPIFHS